MESQYLSILVYGDSKVGKTWFASTGPKPLLVIDAEAGGMRFVPGAKIEWEDFNDAPPEPGEWDICIATVTNSKDIEAIRGWLATGRTCFKSVVVDSLTEMQSRIKREISPSGELRINDWGKLLVRMEDLIVDIRDIAARYEILQCFVLVAGADKRNDKAWPFLQGKIAQVAPYKVDAVGYLQVVVDEEDNERRVLQLGHTSQAMAGNRLGGAFGRYLYDPKLTDMIETLSEHLPEEE